MWRSERLGAASDSSPTEGSALAWPTHHRLPDEVVHEVPSHQRSRHCRREGGVFHRHRLSDRSRSAAAVAQRKRPAAAAVPTRSPPCGRARSCRCWRRRRACAPSRCSRRFAGGIPRSSPGCAALWSAALPDGGLSDARIFLDGSSYISAGLLSPVAQRSHTATPMLNLAGTCQNKPAADIGYLARHLPFLEITRETGFVSLQGWVPRGARAQYRR